MRRKSKLMPLLTLALIGYAAYQMYSLDVRVARLERASSVSSKAATVGKDADIRQAYEHFDRAEKALSDGRESDAKAELEQGLKIMERAVPEAGKQPAGKSGAGANTLVGKLQRLIKVLTESPKKAPAGKPDQPPDNKPAAPTGG